jgi:hypothetical protein
MPLTRLQIAIGIAFLTLPVLSSLAHAVSSDPPSLPEPPCGRFGTSVAFVDTPSEAARQARLQEKLVLVLHVSGHFEDPRFT